MCKAPRQNIRRINNDVWWQYSLRNLKAKHENFTSHLPKQLCSLGDHNWNDFEFHHQTSLAKSASNDTDIDFNINNNTFEYLHNLCYTPNMWGNYFLI